jgi:hypothetical protein
MTELMNRTDIPNLTWSVPECARLAIECDHLKKAYVAAVDRLFSTGYRLNDGEHRKLKTAAENARIRWEAARVLLDNHQRIEEHGTS